VWPNYANHRYAGNPGRPRSDISAPTAGTYLALPSLSRSRAQRLSDAQFRRLLGLNRWEADGLLKAHGVWLDYTIEDFNREGEAGRRIGASASSSDATDSAAASIKVTRACIVGWVSASLPTTSSISAGC
jgi:hypothetical protein